MRQERQWGDTMSQRVWRRIRRTVCAQLQGRWNTSNAYQCRATRSAATESMEVSLCPLILLLALVPLGASAEPHPPAMTGEQFVRDMVAMPKNDLASLRRERAMGYMDGLLDGTVGVRWCPNGQPVAHELSYEAAEQMKRLPPHQLTGSAAELALSMVSKIYPCPTPGSKP